MLPDGTGLELARELLEILPRPHPPIIAVTAYSTPDKIAEARAAGISGFVTKPVSLKKLETAIMNATQLAPLSRSFDAVQSDRYDFSPLLRLENGRQKLVEYADSLGEAWETVVRVCTENPGTPTASHVVHAFRSRVSAVHDQASAEHLKLLEQASAANDADATRTLLATLTPLISDLSAAARQKAFS
jgi:CheY-like chemotaxis protein